MDLNIFRLETSRENDRFMWRSFPIAVLGHSKLPSAVINKLNYLLTAKLMEFT